MLSFFLFVQQFNYLSAPSCSARQACPSALRPSVLPLVLNHREEHLALLVELSCLRANAIAELNSPTALLPPCVINTWDSVDLSCIQLMIGVLPPIEVIDEGQGCPAVIAWGNYIENTNVVAQLSMDYAEVPNVNHVHVVKLNQLCQQILITLGAFLNLTSHRNTVI